MDAIPRILGIVSAMFLFLGLTESQQSQSETQEAKVAVGTVGVTFPAATIFTTTTTSVYVVSSEALCGEWWALALEAGWQESELETLDYVMWKESRCDPTQHNTTRNADGSTDVGLMQINDRSWCLPTRWYPDGYLQTIGLLDSIGCKELFDPFANLKAAKAIHDYAKETSDNGFSPWGA